MKNLILVLLVLPFFVSCTNEQSKAFKVKELNYPSDLSIVKRADWGWLPLEHNKNEADIKYITIHHGGVEFGADKDAVQSIRDLQNWSRKEKGWIDIPYHYMIDLEGKIYEARPINYPGDTNTEYDPTGHALIEVMGNYEIQELSEIQKQSLIKLIAFLSKEFHVPLENIKTHKDYSKITVCPGKNIYKYFEDGSILKSVEKNR